MMIEPSITQLDKSVDSRYTLVIMTAKRARMIGKAQHDAEAEKTEKQNVRTEKPVTIAVNEIAQGKVGYVRSEALAKAQEYEAEKIAAIQSLNDGEYNEGGVVVGEDIVEPVFIDEEE